MHINFIFGITTLLTVFFFYKAARHYKFVLVIIFAWLILLKGKVFIAQLDLRLLTYLHTVRIKQRISQDFSFMAYGYPAEASPHVQLLGLGCLQDVVSIDKLGAR